MSNIAATRPLPAAEVEEEPEPPAENNGTRRSDWETSPAGMRRGHFHGPRRQLLADECDGCMSWEEVQLELLNRFENSWINPFTAQRDIMRGDPASCAAAECTEYTPMENAREIFDAVSTLAIAACPWLVRVHARSTRLERTLCL
eukprot:1331117-Rhodomonas_salina.2